MAHLDYPAVQKTISHVLARRPSTAESSEPDTPASDNSHSQGMEDRATLTPQISRHTQPDLIRYTTKGTTASSANRDPSFEVDWYEYLCSLFGLCEN